MVRAVRDAALLPGPAPIWEPGSVGVLPTSITADDVGLWPYSVGALVKLAAFVGTLHWPASSADLGIVLSFLFSMNFGLVTEYGWRRLSLEAGGLIAEFQCRLFHLDQALILGLVECFVRWVLCLVVQVGYAVWYWCQPLHGLTSRPVRLPLSPSWMSCWFFLVTFPGLGLRCWSITCL